MKLAGSAEDPQRRHVSRNLRGSAKEFTLPHSPKNRDRPIEFTS
jgi:hypothetical protein